MKRTWPTYLTDTAFVLLLGVLIARVWTSDALRDPTEVQPGGILQARQPGPATALVLDALLTVPALLVLARRAVDREYRSPRTWAAVPMFVSAVWAVASTAWASDRFAAVVTGAHWIAAAAVFWSAVQLMGAWSRLRLVVGLAFGLLLVLSIQAGLHEFVDKAADVEYWNQNKPKILAERGMAPDSFSARQFEQKVMTGEFIGFFKSANSTAAVAVMLLVVGAAVGLQNRSDRRRLAFTIVSAGAAAFVLYLAGSKTAVPTAVLGVVSIVVYAVFADRIRPHSRRLFVAGWAITACAAGVVVTVGVARHGLLQGHFSNSLDFRWKYWTASVGVFEDHPVVGVGADNFGLSYLAHRLPEAAEAIKDPHNFLVRAACELGLVGLVATSIAVFGLVRAMTVPGRVDVESGGPADHVRMVGFVVAVAIALSLTIHLDLNLSILSQSVDALRLVMYAAVLGGAMIVVAVRSTKEWFVDDEPAFVLRAGLVVGVFVFLVHNLIDFSMFETNAMPLLAVLAGGAVGANSNVSAHRASITTGRAWLCAMTFVWLASVGGLVLPVLVAESSIAEADELVRVTPVDSTPGAKLSLDAAVARYRTAVATVPYNSDYAVRTARAEYRAGDPKSAGDYSGLAMRLNPRSIDALLLDAQINLSGDHPDTARITFNFDRAVALNPNDVSLRMIYADALDRLGLSPVTQLQAALSADDALPADEPQRMSAEKIVSIRSRIDSSSHRPHTPEIK